MMPLRVVLLAALVTALPSFGRTEKQICGTHAETAKEQLFLHERAVQLRYGKTNRLAAPVWTRAARGDAGNIAILEDTDGVVSRRNQFSLGRRTLTFTPSDATASRYRFAVSGDTYAAPADATPVALGDDDASLEGLPFSFPFFGQSYRQVYVGSDGNLTFGSEDATSAARTLGRLSAGPPRIAGLYGDLDPSRRPGSVLVSASATRFVVTYDGVPEYADFGNGLRQTFQIRLYPDGKIEMAWTVVNISEAVVGISPGGLTGNSTVLAFLDGSAAEFSGTVAERFSFEEEIDIVTAAQKFYANHDDSYDYLVFYNALGLGALSGAVAYENTVRSFATGFGDAITDNGRLHGSARRLQAVLNLGPVSQYPVDPNGLVSSRAISRDTPLTVLAHEAGHLFLALASTRDPLNPDARPMLGYQNAHWAFTTNSEASLLEGNRLRDNGPAVRPRFTTVGVTEGFSALDQYLMGLRAPDEVPPTFYVTGTASSTRLRQPELNISFDGERVDVRVEDIISAEGRRTPDSTVAQRRYRFAFILVVRAGSDPSPSVLEQVDRYRQEFEGFYRRATGERAWADTSLRRAVQLSASPASGVLQGAAATASVTVQQPVEAPLTLTLRSTSGNISLPDSVTIPAGRVSQTFDIGGVRAGVDEIVAAPVVDTYETAYARVQVTAGVSNLKLEVISGDRQRPTSGQPLSSPIVFRLTDINNLPYAGVRVNVAASGGTLPAPFVVTDVNGQATVGWTPASSGVQTLTARVEGGPSATASTLAPRVVGRAVNAASFAQELAPGSLATIFGTGLTDALPATARSIPWPEFLGGTRVLVNGITAPLLYVSPTQINFLVPPTATPGPARIVIEAAGLNPADAPVTTLVAAAPGVFYDAATGYGAILHPNTAETTFDRPAARGGFVEIYCTGLGATLSEESLATTLSTPVVTIGGVRARVTFSARSPIYAGLYQVNVEIAPETPTGKQPLIVTVDGAASNAVSIGIR